MSFGLSSCTKENASTLVELNPGQSITLTHKNTVSVNLPSDRNVSIAIETPTNDFLLLHTPDGIVSLWTCLLYTSDAADEGLGVDLGGRRSI